MYASMGEVDGNPVSYPFYVWQRAEKATRKTFKCTWRPGTRGNPGDWEPINAKDREEYDKGPTSDPLYYRQPAEGKGRSIGISTPTFCEPAGKCQGKIWQYHLQDARERRQRVLRRIK